MKRVSRNNNELDATELTPDMEKAQKLEEFNNKINNFFEFVQQEQDEILNETYRQAVALNQMEIYDRCVQEQEENKVVLTPSCLRLANDIVSFGIDLMKESNNDVNTVLANFGNTYLQEIFPICQNLRTIQLCLLLSKLTNVADACQIVDCLREDWIPILQEENRMEIEIAANLAMAEILDNAQNLESETLQSEEVCQEKFLGQMIIHEAMPFLLHLIQIHCQYDRMNYLLERENEAPELDSLEYRAQIKNDQLFLRLLYYVFFRSGENELYDSAEQWEVKMGHPISEILSNGLSDMWRISYLRDEENYRNEDVEPFFDSGNWINIFQQIQYDLSGIDKENQSIRREDMIKVNEHLVYLIQSAAELMQRIEELFCLRPDQSETESADESDLSGTENENNLSSMVSDSDTFDTKNNRNLSFMEGRQTISFNMLTQQGNTRPVPQAGGNNNNNQNVLSGPKK